MKRIFVSLIAAVLLAGASFGGVLAADEPPAEIERLRGEVTQVDAEAGKFRIQDSEGVITTLFVDENTRYRGQLTGLDEMQVGWKVLAGAREEDGKLWAVLVVAGDLPELEKTRGEITQVDPEAGKFRLQTPEGVVETFFVDDDTRYGGQIQSLDDLQIGWSAGVVYRELDGKTTARLLVAGEAPDLTKVQGTVTEVDAGAGKFRLEESNGSVTTFFVDESTRYQGQLNDLSELQPGWKAGVAAREDQDGKLSAVLVIAGERPETVRVQGIITQVDAGAGKFRLEKEDGSVVTFFTDPQTRYKGKISSLDELEVGARAGAAGVVQDDGKYLARIVIAGKPSNRGEAQNRDSSTSPLEVPAQ